MRAALIASIVGTLVAVAGCATTSQEDIDDAAALAFGSRLCGDAEWISKETAAKGVALANSMVYREDTPRYHAKIKELMASREQATRSTCKEVEMVILTREASRNMRSRTPAAQPTMPTQTTCHQVFGQMRCTTY